MHWLQPFHSVNKFSDLLHMLFVAVHIINIRFYRPIYICDGTTDVGSNLLCASASTSFGSLSTVVLVRPRLPRLALVDQLGRVRHPRAKRFPLGVL